MITNPASSKAEPALSLTPAVLGEAEPEDGIIISTVHFPALSAFGPGDATVKHPTENPTYEIQIFNGAECPGAPIAKGSAAELEEAGIEVTVAADTKSALSAIQVDPGTSEVSTCSNVLYYWEGNVPAEEVPAGEGGGSGGGGGSEAGTGGGSPAATGGSSAGGSISNGTPVTGKPEAPHIHVSPSAWANDVTPLVVGSAPGAGKVMVYASGNCSGAAVVDGAASQFASGFEVPVAKNAVTTFSAVAIGSEHSSCSSPVTYTEDSIPPRTRITMGPGVKTRKRRAVFRFTDVTEDPPGTTFRCLTRKLGKPHKVKWRPCSSPLRLEHLEPGRYLVKIQATDLAGNHERRPVKRGFTVVGHG